MEADATHRGVGRDGVRDLAADVWTQEHSLAQCGLPDTRGDARAGGADSCTEFFSLKVKLVTREP